MNPYGLVWSNGFNGTAHVRSSIRFATRITTSEKWRFDDTGYTGFYVYLNATVGDQVHIGWQLTYDQADATWFTLIHNITKGKGLISDLNTTSFDVSWAEFPTGPMPAHLSISFTPALEGEMHVLLSYSAECFRPYGWPQELVTFTSNGPVHEVVIYIKPRQALQLGPLEVGLIATAVTTAGALVFYFRSLARRSQSSARRGQTEKPLSFG